MFKNSKKGNLYFASCKWSLKVLTFSSNKTDQDKRKYLVLEPEHCNTGYLQCQRQNLIKSSPETKMHSHKLLLLLITTEIKDIPAENSQRSA